jgi:hypothetical protein
MNSPQLSTALLLIIVGCVVFTLVNSMLPHETKVVQQIKFDRDELVRIDSLLDIREKKVLDSVAVVIDALKSQDKRLNDFNTKIRKQNEKLDKIYSGIDIDRPDF